MSSKSRYTYGIKREEKEHKCAFCGSRLEGKVGVILDIFKECYFCDKTCRDKFHLGIEIVVIEMERDVWYNEQLKK